MAASPADGTRSHAPAPIFFSLAGKSPLSTRALERDQACLPFFFLAVYTFLFLIFSCWTCVSWTRGSPCPAAARLSPQKSEIKRNKKHGSVSNRKRKINDKGAAIMKRVNDLHSKPTEAATAFCREMMSSWKEEKAKALENAPSAYRHMSQQTARRREIARNERRAGTLVIAAKNNFSGIEKIKWDFSHRFLPFWIFVNQSSLVKKLN